MNEQHIIKDGGTDFDGKPVDKKTGIMVEYSGGILPDNKGEGCHQTITIYLDKDDMKFVVVRGFCLGQPRIKEGRFDKFEEAWEKMGSLMLEDLKGGNRDKIEECHP